MTALKAADVDAFVARPDKAHPVVLIYGPDSGLVGERAQAIVRASVDNPDDPFSLVRVEGDAPPRVNGAALPGEGSLLASGEEVEIAGARLRFHPGR